MALISFYLDTRRDSEDGLYPLRLRIFHRRAIMISVNIYCKRSEWRDGEFAPRAQNSRARNVQLREILNKVERFLFDNADEVAFLSDKALRGRITQLLALSPKRSATLLSFMLRAREGLSPRTQALYKWAADKVIAYDDDVAVSGVTDAWVKGFVLRQRNEGLTNNSIILLFSYIARAVQLAVEEGEIPRRPYTSLRVRATPTRKRSLSVEQLRELRDMQLTGREEWARDMFLLSFYLLGINVADMWGLRSIAAGRIEYRRRKTGQLYSVAVPDEALAIIERHRGEGEQLLDWQGLRTAGAACTILTRYLGRLIPGLTTYYARHSWATLAAELEIPIETISHALGHKIGSPTTAIYVAFNQRKVDKANRQVIDYLNAD